MIQKMFPHACSISFLRTITVALTFNAQIGAAKGTVVAEAEEAIGDHIVQPMEDNYHNSQSSCRIYYARSSLEEEAGYGLFTVHDISQGEEFLRAPDGPSIPVIDSFNGDEEWRLHWNHVWNEYWWGRALPDQTRYEADFVFDYQIMFGALPNHHCIIDSINSGPYPELQYDDTLVPRNSPGLGAFSYHMGRRFVANRDVRAGEELFLNYGACDREKGHQRYFMEKMAVTADYERAADIVLSMWEVAKQHLSHEMLTKDLRLYALGDYDLLSNATVGTFKYDHINNEYVKSLLPESTAELYKLIGYSGHVSEESPELNYHNIIMNMAYEKSIPARRSVDWIIENGMCAENLIPKSSTLQDAGQGGFAQYFVAKGDIVTPVPLLQIPDKSLMVVRDDDGKPTGRWQLLLNYCLGHNMSSLLLCPTTNAILINHCSNRTKQCGELGPNAEYRWASWDQRSMEWLNRSVKEIAQSSDRVLTMEVVALRDIHPGDEVFIDYGEDWEKAWEEHTNNWEPPLDDEYTSPTSFNLQPEIDEQLISGNLRDKANLPHPLIARCVYWTTSDNHSEVWDIQQTLSNNGKSWRDLSDDEIMSAYADDGSRYRATYQEHFDLDYWPCDVLKEDTDLDESQTNGGKTYIVRILPTSQHHSHIEAKWKDNTLPRLLFNYPRSSIHFFVESYESDQHHLKAFRYPIGIRDEIFPDQWKNLN